MFERFTDQSRRAVVLAQDEARSLNHNYIGTEHLLAGLRRENRGVAARVLESSGITMDGVRAEIEKLVGRGQLAGSGHIPSHRRPRSPWSSRCGKPSTSAITTSAPGTCCSG